MNRPGALLDTGPLVALLVRTDNQHERAKAMFARCQPPLRTCESVVSEACYLLRKVGAHGPEAVLALAEEGVFEIAIEVKAHLARMRVLLKKYADQEISLADASLICCAEAFHDARILTFDRDFAVYRFGRASPFHIIE